jgi:dihydroorotase-like cyclic amidohydrolase
MLEMRRLLKKGWIDLIETDHAPHSQEEKTKAPFMSGIRSLEIYDSLIEGLLTDGFTEEQIAKLTYSNVKQVYTKIKE